MKQKINIIKQLTRRHPSYGVEKGWGEYTGGMKDSGFWYFEKMLDVPIYKLKAFLCEILAEENLPPRIYTEQEKSEMNTIRYHSTGSGVYWSNDYEDKIESNHRKALDRAMFFGI